MRWALIAAVISGSAWGQDAGTPDTLVFLQFESNKEGADQVAPVSALVASDLSQASQLKVVAQADVAAAIGLERQKALMGAQCDESCMTELSGALGARYLLRGRVDRFGDHYLLTASLFDAHHAKSIAKPRVEVAGPAELPGGARMVAAQLLKALGLALPGPEPGPNVYGANLGPMVAMKVGSSFFQQLKSFNLEGSLQLGYRFQPEWVGFLEIGFTIATSRLENGGITIVPSVLGVKHLYRVANDLQPYWGFALGVQLSIGSFGPISQTGPLPAVLCVLGLEYLLLNHLSVGAELSTNVSQAILGIAQSGAGSGSGINLSFTGVVSWRF